MMCQYFLKLRCQALTLLPFLSATDKKNSWWMLYSCCLFFFGVTYIENPRDVLYPILTHMYGRGAFSGFSGTEYMLLPIPFCSTNKTATSRKSEFSSLTKDLVSRSAS